MMPLRLMLTIAPFEFSGPRSGHDLDLSRGVLLILVIFLHLDPSSARVRSLLEAK